MCERTGKSPAQSVVETRYLLMPHEASPFGTAFGGVILGWMDMVAGMAAQRHCSCPVVTAGMDSVSFQEPIQVGDHVVLRACVNYTGRTSLEVGVQVTREDPNTCQAVLATTGHFTFVALDEHKRPTPVPPVLPQTILEKERYEQARLRAEARKRQRERG